MQWRAKAIGEKSAAAEAKLEDAGPYEKMTLRTAMSTVLRVLEGVLGNDFSVESVEMVCVDASCGPNKGQTESALEGGLHDDDKVVRSGGSRNAGKKSTFLATGADKDVDNAGNRDLGGKRGVVDAVARPNLFRRVSKDEMEALLLEEKKKRDGNRNDGR